MFDLLASYAQNVYNMTFCDIASKRSPTSRITLLTALCVGSSSTEKVDKRREALVSRILDKCKEPVENRTPEPTKEPIHMAVASANDRVC